MQYFDIDLDERQVNANPNGLLCHWECTTQEIKNAQVILHYCITLVQFNRYNSRLRKNYDRLSTI